MHNFGTLLEYVLNVINIVTNLEKIYNKMKRHYATILFIAFVILGIAMS